MLPSGWKSTCRLARSTAKWSSSWATLRVVRDIDCRSHRPTTQREGLGVQGQVQIGVVRSQAPKPAALEAGPLHRHAPQPGRPDAARPRPARPKRLSRRIPHRLAHLRRGPPVQVALKQQAKDLAPLGFDELPVRRVKAVMMARSE